MKNIWLVTLLVMLFTSCTKVNSDEKLPSVDLLTPLNIVTKLPVVNIEGDADEINHMMVRYNSPIEVATSITIYGTNKEILVQDDAVIEIRGVGSAAQEMKPLGIVFQHSFNNQEKQLIQPKVVAPGDDLKTIQNIRLRNSSQDYGYTMIKDLAYSEFALRTGFDLELKYGRAAHVFINSKYYGMHNLRTEVDRLALGYSLNVDSADITMLKMNTYKKKLKYKEGNELLGRAFIQAIKDEDVYAIRTYLDIENFIDYIVFQDYIGNEDWPHNNARAYSVNGSKFRFLLYDLDLATTRTKNFILPEMEYDEDHISIIYQILLKQDLQFQSQLKERQKYWYEKLSPALFNEIVDELAREIESEIPYLISRRGVPKNSFQWKLNLEQIKTDLENKDRNNRKKYNIK